MAQRRQTRYNLTATAWATLMRKKRFDLPREVRKLARERVGRVPASKPIPPKPTRRKPKHRRSLTEESED